MLAPFYPELSREVREFVKAQAEKRRYVFVGEPLVRFMIDPQLRAGKFSVFAENVDAPTLGRLYEEERAYQNGLGQNNSAASRAASAPRAGKQQFAAPQQQRPAAMPQQPAPRAAAPDPLAVADPFAPNAPDPAAAPIPVPQTVSRDALAGMGGAAATGAAVGLGAAAGIASNMASTRAPQRPLAQLVDVVSGENIDIVLFAGRIVLVALLYIFLFAVMKTGVGLVRGQRRDSAIWTIDVDKGPRGIRGIHVDMLGPVIVGRSPSSDICINEPFVSASHARFSLQGPALIIEDLNSLNGTLVNGRQLVEPATLREGDEVQIGDVVMKVNRR